MINILILICYLMVLILIGFFLDYYLAKKSRQTRGVTTIDFLRMRFGKTSEQFFTFTRIPNSFLGGDIQLI